MLLQFLLGYEAYVLHPRRGLHGSPDTLIDYATLEVISSVEGGINAHRDDMVVVKENGVAIHVDSHRAIGAFYVGVSRDFDAPDPPLVRLTIAPPCFLNPIPAQGNLVCR